MTTATPPPGLYPDVPFQEYLEWDAMSKSVLNRGRQSMAHLRAAMDTPAKVTDAMNIGSALDCAFLEPELMMDRVVLWGGERRAGNAWKEFQSKHYGKIILTQGHYETMQNMVRSLRRHPFVKQWIGRMEHVQCSAVGDVVGVRCKARCDVLTDDPLVDLKSTSTLDMRILEKNIYDFGYHIQAYLYTTLFNRSKFILLFVEKQPPYDVVPYQVDERSMLIARQEVLGLLERYKRCLKTNEWPGMSSEVQEIGLPSYVGPADEHNGVKLDKLKYKSETHSTPF